jgi:two-component system sensor histidine kinase UhpB
MSLRLRLTLLINGFFLLILLAGSVLVTHNARRAVADEMISTANLTLGLLELVFSTEGRESSVDIRLLERLTGIEPTRHLKIELIRESGRTSLTRYTGNPRSLPRAPAWFVELVSPDEAEIRREVAISEDARIVIRPDPGDEISEAWLETRLILVLSVLLLIIANIVVYITIGWSLRPVSSILDGLQRIERGDYQARLPQLSLPELNAISESFNHTASVLERSRRETRRLAKESLAIQEAERRSLAHELHDELGQAISAIKAVAISITQQVSNRDDRVSEAAETIAQISDGIYATVRSMMRRLRPASLDELGLISALEEMVADWNSRYDSVVCEFQADGRFDKLSEALEIGLYRIVQESLTNVAKHADAARVDIRLAIDGQDMGQRVMLTIADDGKGLDLATVTPGLGLLGMRERTESLGGTFGILSEPGGGVRISLFIPIAATKVSDDDQP